MTAALQAGANLVMHAAGWLEGGLIASASRSSSSTSRCCATLRDAVHADRDRRGEPRLRRARRGRPRRPLPRRRAHARALPRLLLPAATRDDGELRALDARTARSTPRRAPPDRRRALAAYEEPPLDDAVRAELDAYVRGGGASSATDRADRVGADLRRRQPAARHRRPLFHLRQARPPTAASSATARPTTRPSGRMSPRG